VLQRPSPSRKNAGRTYGPLNFGRLKTPRQPSTGVSFLASSIRAWQMREFCRFFRTISACLAFPVYHQPARNLAG
jgi:hypothetical protein